MRLMACTLGYLLLEPLPSKTHFPALSVQDVSSWLDAALYSLQAMTFLRPQDYILTGLGKAIYIAQSLLGPLFLGLFALAVRQRLKR